MRTRTQNQISEVAELVYYLNNKYDVFLSYAGHVDLLEVRFYEEWQGGNNGDWTIEVHTKVDEYHSQESIDESFKELIEKLESYIYINE